MMTELFTSIDSVNIFRNGAEVVRKGQAELKAGKQELCVHGLSGTADINTARLFSSESLECYNIRYKNYEEDERPSLELLKEIEDLQKEIEVKQLQISLWQTNGDFSNKNNIGAGDIEEYIEKLPERLNRLNEELRDLQEKEKELNKKYQESQQLDRLYLMIVDVMVEKDGLYNFELKYHENSASWDSIYEVHSDAREDLEIKMKGKVSQWTHEDWKDVSVSLFSGNPSLGGTLPEITPVYLDAQEKTTVRRTFAKANGMRREAMMMDMEVEESAEAPFMGEAMMASARMVTPEAIVSNDDETMTEYILSGRRDIYKGSNSAMVDLQSYKIPCEYQIVTAAKLDPSAYLVATIKTEDLPFTEYVDADIYLNGMYTGSTELDPDFSKDKIDITLGKEERIHVSYKETLKKQSQVLLKGQKVIEYAYETSITNNTESPVRVLYRNQIPVSQNKEVTVETVDLDGAELDKDTGILTKEVEVGPKEIKKINLAYKVSYPKDKDLRERH